MDGSLGCGEGGSGTPFLGEQVVHVGEGLPGGANMEPSLFPCQHPCEGIWFCWTGGGKGVVRVHRGHGLPHLRSSICLLPSAFGVPQRVSGSLVVTGHPVLWDGDHAIRPTSVSGVSRL